MNIFTSVIFQIAVLFSFILIGFILCRLNLLPREASTVFSRLENRILMPAVVINTFRTNCTIENITHKWVKSPTSTAILAFCILVVFIVAGFSAKHISSEIHRYSIAVSNFGLSVRLWFRDYGATA